MATASQPSSIIPASRIVKQIKSRERCGSSHCVILRLGKASLPITIYLTGKMMHLACAERIAAEEVCTLRRIFANWQKSALKLPRLQPLRSLYQEEARQLRCYNHFFGSHLSGVLLGTCFRCSRNYYR